MITFRNFLEATQSNCLKFVRNKIARKSKVILKEETEN